MMNNQGAKAQSELTLAKVLPTLLILGMIAAFILVGLFTGGCTVTRVHSGDGATRSSVTSYTVAWPWLDTTKALEKAKLGAKTNSSEIALSGYSESESMSTNAAAFMERGISAAVGAAVKAVK